ncbi:hypothetical protein MASR1M68_00160 [Elusimicrobiota bacterium]
MEEKNDSGIISNFQFLGYKVDSFKVKNKNKVMNILNYFKGNENWMSSISVRQPTLYKTDLLFLGGIRLVLALHEDTIEAKDRSIDNALISLDCSIVGLFKIIDIKDFENNKKVYEDLGKYQIPAILSPYLRATVTSYFANAGYGSFMFPLINFTQIAHDDNVKLEIVE